MISLLGTYITVQERQNEYYRKFHHLMGEVYLGGKNDDSYRYLFGLMVGVKGDKIKATKAEIDRVIKALKWLKKNNPLFETFYSNCETVWGHFQGFKQIAGPGDISTTKGEDIVDEMGDETQVYLLPADKTEGDPEFKWDDFTHQVAHPKENDDTIAEQWNRMRRPGLFSQNVEAMGFPCEFPGGMIKYSEW